MKKRRCFTAEGSVIVPHEKYTPSLAEFYKLEHRVGRVS